MVGKPTGLARKVLHEISSKSDESPFETLHNLLEILESKEEPDSNEIYLVSNLYQILEKIKLLESQLRQYVGSGNITAKKLSELYEKVEGGYGSSKIFK